VNVIIRPVACDPRHLLSISLSALAFAAHAPLCLKTGLHQSACKGATCVAHNYYTIKENAVESMQVASFHYFFA
jgi:hypothetical protein